MASRQRELLAGPVPINTKQARTGGCGAGWVATTHNRCKSPHAEHLVLKIRIFQGLCRVEMLSQHVSISSFLRNAKSISKTILPFYTTGCEVLSHCGFNFPSYDY